MLDEKHQSSDGFDNTADLILLNDYKILQCYEYENAKIFCNDDGVLIIWGDKRLLWNKNGFCSVSIIENNRMKSNDNDRSSFDAWINNCISHDISLLMESSPHDIYADDNDSCNKIRDKAFAIADKIIDKLISIKENRLFPTENVKFYRAQYPEYDPIKLYFIFYTKCLFGHIFACKFTKIGNPRIRYDICHIAILNLLKSIHNRSDNFEYLRTIFILNKTRRRFVRPLDDQIFYFAPEKIPLYESIDPKRLYECLFIDGYILELCEDVTGMKFKFSGEEVELINKLNEKCGDIILKNYKKLKYKFYAKLLLGLLVLGSAIVGFVKSGYDTYFVPLIIFFGIGVILSLLYLTNDFYTEFVKLDESRFAGKVTKLPRSCECVPCCSCICRCQSSCCKKTDDEFMNKNHELYWCIDIICCNKDPSYDVKDIRSLLKSDIKMNLED
jgi:hypothetical protein